MSFFESQQGDSNTKTRRRSWRDTFIQLTPGDPVTVRIVEPEIVAENKVWKHFIPQARTKAGRRGLTVPCPGIEVCPICARNKELGDREHPDYIKAFPSFFAHALDLTPRKTCDLCKTVNTGNTCTYDDNDLSELPLDETVLKILEGSKTMFEQIDTVESTIQAVYDPNRPSMLAAHKDPRVQEEHKSGREVMVPVGITGYNLQLVTTRNDDRRTVTPVPASAPDDFDYREYENQYISKWDAWLLLTSDEILELVQGASLVELLKARNSSGNSSLDTDAGL